MLGLKLKTDPRWVNLAEKNLDFILTDHAYCEQKATTNCISLIQAFPEKKELVDELMPVVTEEWGHFRMVLTELEKRNLKLGKQRKDEYVIKLIAFQKKGGSREEWLTERLLTSALIEARSCERFRLLSEELEDEDLRKFYYKLMVSEAGHYRMFLDLAKKYADESYVKQRWAEYLEYEGEMISELELRGDRVH